MDGKLRLKALPGLKPPPAIPGNGRHNNDEEKHGNQDRVEANAPGGIIQNEPY